MYAASYALSLRAAAAALALGLSALVAFTPAHAAQGKGPDSVADVAERVLDAVVNISTSQTIEAGKGMQMPQVPPGSPFEEFFDEFFKNRGGDSGRSRKVSSLGSGFVVDPSGIVVTNNHVIAEADEIFVNFNDGTKLKAEVVGRDTKSDIAILRVKPENPVKAVIFGDSDKMRVGDWVMAIGNPFGLGGSVTVGVVSARNRDINAGPYDNFIQTDAAINRGNSGGPLFNMDGEVIGINTAIISPSGGSIGIGFAIPSKSVTGVIAQLREFGETRRGWIGVKIQNVDDAIAESLSLGHARGALVAGVTDGGPASKAGIQSGDVIVKFDGRDIKEMRDLPKSVADTAVGKTVDIVFIRKGKEQTARVTLGRLEDAEKPQKASLSKETPPEAKPAAKTSLGLGLSGITDDLKKRYKIKDGAKGVLVVTVDPNSPAAERGIQPGDVIVEVGQEAVANPADVQKRLEALKKDGKKSTLLLVTRADEQRFVPVTIP
ncbi:MAG TPA: DegQ family serine endoprotease [Xanthobacteraceae bacterium]|nr:DegQ family serine endoprotease [Xanthobacteraceae bacterium]